jgi:hypothetical protein
MMRADLESPSSHEEKQMSDEPSPRISALNRRDLLKTGVASGAALAFLAGCKQEAKQSSESETCDFEWPAPGESVEAVAVDECPEKKDGSAALPSPYEEIETAMDLMWCQFQRACYEARKDPEIHFEAIEFARLRVRAQVADYIKETANGTPKDALRKFVDEGYSTSFEADWKRTAEDAARDATTEISKAILGGAWKGIGIDSTSQKRAPSRRAPTCGSTSRAARSTGERAGSASTSSSREGSTAGSSCA